MLVKYMTKYELLDGMVVECINGEKAVVSNGMLIFENGYAYIFNYTLDLIYKCLDTCLDIIKVYSVSKKDILNNILKNVDRLELLWERKR